jgi:superoxide dismutase, Fe-Mn family
MRWRGRSINGRTCRRPSTCPRQSTDRNQGDALPSQTDAIRSEIHHWHLGKGARQPLRKQLRRGTQLAELDFAKAPIFVINGLKREELVASNSMILHEIYFDGLGGGARASGPLADAIARDFGSMERWRSEFVAMGKAEGGGSGWVILAYSPREKRLVNQWAADHTTTLAGGRPVLVLDMYEHAYHMDYGAAAARYVDVYMEAIRWDNAAKLYEHYSRET